MTLPSDECEDPTSSVGKNLLQLKRQHGPGAEMSDTCQVNCPVCKYQLGYAVLDTYTETLSPNYRLPRDEIGLLFAHGVKL